MTGSGFDLRDLVSRQIAMLEQQHRAGITPSYGQVENLFDLGRLLGDAAEADRAAAAPRTPVVVSRPVPARCSRPGCHPLTTEREVIDGQSWCPSCAVDLQLLHRSAARMGVAVTRVRWPRQGEVA